MPVPRSRDPELARRDLEVWLAERLGAPVAITRFDMPRASGFSNETVLLDAVVGGETLALVARVAPAAYTLFPDYDLTAQRRVLEGLAGTDVPVPAVHWSGPAEASPFGSEFFLMDRVPGQAAPDVPPYTARGWLLDASPAQQRTAYVDGLAQLVRVAAVDWAATGLDLVVDPELGPPGVQQELAYYRAYLPWMAGERRLPLFEDTLDWLAASAPAGGELCFSWGDARLGNQLFEDFRVTAVLDWEMAALCPPEADLGYWLAVLDFYTVGHGLPPLPGFPGRSETIELYEALGGRPPADLHWWEVFGIFRFAILLARLGDMLRATGALPEGRPGPEVPATTVLRNLLLAAG